VKVLEQAQLRRAASLIITTHDDDTNIYLTILCRRLRPDLQIISRCTAERNVATLHRAGADLVLSYGSMGANAIFNLLRGRNTLLMGEGVNIFSVRVPASLAGKTLAQGNVRSRTGCTVIAVEAGGRRTVNPPADHTLPPDGELFLMGTLAAEEQFLETFVRSRGRR
jgi:Trk K+ transport system NAD-binding subunit